MWNQRSVDTFLGLPFNIASYGTLLLLLCEETNLEPGELIGNLGDTHLYKNHIEQAEEQRLRRKSFQLPSVKLSNVISFKMVNLIMKLSDINHNQQLKHH
jgi:thymidylate synthase